MDHVDPQQWFAQFSPQLHFDHPENAPLLNDNNVWFTVGQQSVPTNRESFWKTVKRWTTEPQFVIPPIERAELETHDNNTSHPNLVTRVLIPKRQSKDALLRESVEYHENHDHDTYVGAVEYHPLVLAYRFVYTSVGSGGDRQPEIDTVSHNQIVETSDLEEMEHGVLQLDIKPWTPLEPAILNEKMQYALKTLLHKLFKWCIQARIGYKKHAHHDRVIPKDNYIEMYQHMKQTYAEKLISQWPEKTDPVKFVFEDIAIASFLLCLWAEEEKQIGRKPTFIDLGCGNGLLTFLLASEGYHGHGVDLSDRKVWSLLKQNHCDLRVETLQPAKDTYTGVDWFIGNHADELVPWVPVIAARSGDSCKFMVIPCCFFGLDGTRNAPFLGKDIAHGEGKYRTYTNYIKDIALQCGYECEEEYLRIPSTKNIAIIGRKRHEVDFAQLDRIAQVGAAFQPRKSDREMQAILLQRQQMKRDRHTEK